MSTDFQVTFDCVDPHRLMRFWAVVLSYEVEDHDPMIRDLLEAGVATPDDVMELDGRLVWRTAAACRDPKGRRPRLLFQQVPEAKVVKNRVHIDLHVGEQRRDAEVERLLALGASKLYEASQGPQTWVTMADPEGNELCVS